jgi:hypothetical protein
VIEFLSVWLKCCRPNVADALVLATRLHRRQEEQDGVAADLRVRTESSDTRALTTLVSWPLGASSCDGRWLSLRCVLFLRVTPKELAEVKSVESENGGACWRISKV